jgi:hypothetical protein
MKKLYFNAEESDPENCYTLEYWRWFLSYEEVKEVKLHPAIPEKIGDVFWCREYEAFYDIEDKPCGKWCDGYKPRNGKSGCCVNLSHISYSPDKSKVKTLSIN